MKKNTILITASITFVLALLAFVVVSLFAGGTTLFKEMLELYSQKNWATLDISVYPYSSGTYWETEGGHLSFENGTENRTGTITDKPLTGLFRVPEQELEVIVDFSPSDRRLVLYINDGTPYDRIVEYLEVWEAIDWSETDAQIVIDLKVIETTYFEEGQIIKLIHNKEQ